MWKTNLLLNKLQLFRLDNTEQQLKIITRSPEKNTATLALHEIIEDISVEEDLKDRAIQEYQNCCVVFDMLNSNQRLIDPFLGHERSEMPIW